VELNREQIEIRFQVLRGLLPPSAHPELQQLVQAALSALSPAKVEGVEPVAWRYQPEGSAQWVLVNRRDGMSWADAKRGIVPEPLYTAAQLAAEVMKEREAIGFAILATMALLVKEPSDHADYETQNFNAGLDAAEQAAQEVIRARSTPTGEKP